MGIASGMGIALAFCIKACKRDAHAFSLCVIRFGVAACVLAPVEAVSASCYAAFNASARAGYGAGQAIHGNGRSLMIETTTDGVVFVVPDWLPMDTEESVLGTQWHQEAIDALATMLGEVAGAMATPGAWRAGSPCWAPAPATLMGNRTIPSPTSWSSRIRFRMRTSPASP